MSEQAKPFTEILILNNPMSYREVDPESFEALIQDGVWIPIVFNTLKTVVENHFYDLCELNWDYLRAESGAPENYARYKNLFHTGLNDEQVAFAQKVADEIEEELRRNALDAVAAKREEGDDDATPEFDE